MITTTATKPIEPHAKHSVRLMDHAWEQLRKGDRLQASEKAWGAVAHRVKAIAKARGWKYATHGDIYDLGTRIAKETDDPDLVEGLFDTAHNLHRNFYQDSQTVERLEHRLSRIDKLLDILEDPALLKKRRHRFPRQLIAARDRHAGDSEMRPR